MVEVALTHLPSDDEPDLVDLYRSSHDELRDVVVQDAIEAYVADGDITDFASAKREFERRQRARHAWTLDELTTRELDEAWQAVQVEAAGDLWSDEHLGVALAVADAAMIPLFKKGSMVVNMLRRWDRNVPTTRSIAAKDTDDQQQRTA